MESDFPSHFFLFFGKALQLILWKAIVQVRRKSQFFLHLFNES